MTRRIPDSRLNFRERVKLKNTGMQTTGASYCFMCHSILDYCAPPCPNSQLERFLANKPIFGFACPLFRFFSIHFQRKVSTFQVFFFTLSKKVSTFQVSIFVGPILIFSENGPLGQADRFSHLFCPLDTVERVKHLWGPNKFRREMLANRHEMVRFILRVSEVIRCEGDMGSPAEYGLGNLSDLRACKRVWSIGTDLKVFLN